MPAEFDLSFSRYRFLIEAQDRIKIGSSYWGNALRGLLIGVWKPAVCRVLPGQMEGQCNIVEKANKSKVVEECKEKWRCSFGRVFEMLPPPGAEPRLAASGEPPRPYALLPGRSFFSILEPGSLAAFDLVLIGNARGYLKEFCSAFIKGEDEGIGIGRGRYRLRQVATIDLDDQTKEIVYSGSFTNRDSTHFSWKDVKEWAAARFGGAQRITATFDTLTRIIQKPHPLLPRPYSAKTPVSPGTFFETFRAVFRVVRDLASLDDKNPVLDKEMVTYLEDLSVQIETTAEELRLAIVYRKSGEERNEHRVEGYEGWVSYQGDLEPFMPWLALGQYLHIGQFRVEGLGAYRLTR